MNSKLRYLEYEEKMNLKSLCMLSVIPNGVYLNPSEILILNITKNMGLGWNKLVK